MAVDTDTDDFNSPPRGDGNMVERRSMMQWWNFNSPPHGGHVAQAAEIILRRGSCRIGMHIEKKAEFAMRTQRGFAEILELFRSCADCVRGRFAQTALRSGFTTAIFAEGISTHPRAGTVTSLQNYYKTLFHFNSHPRGDGNILPRLPPALRAFQLTPTRGR